MDTNNTENSVISWNTCFWHFDNRFQMITSYYDSTKVLNHTTSFIVQLDNFTEDMYLDYNRFCRQYVDYKKGLIPRPQDGRFMYTANMSETNKSTVLFIIDCDENLFSIVTTVDGKTKLEGELLINLQTMASLSNVV